MAKREAPEINAGSMADIAFLLLIFFLVTTTMEKDTAYLRKIPKKVTTDEPQPPVQKKNIYKITINSKNVIQARDSLIQPQDIGELNNSIKHFYLVNRDKKTDREKDFPYYSFGTIQIYKSNRNEQINRLNALESKLESFGDKEGHAEEKEKLEKQIAQANDAISKWGEKLEMMKLYKEFSGKDEMPEIAIDAHIRVEPFNDTDYSAYIAVQSEVQKAVTELRDEESEKIFGVSYSTMNNLYQQHLTEDTPEINKIEKHMELIETLFPLKLIEVKPKN